MFSSLKFQLKNQKLFKGFVSFAFFFPHTFPIGFDVCFIHLVHAPHFGLDFDPLGGGEPKIKAANVKTLKAILEIVNMIS